MLTTATAAKRLLTDHSAEAHNVWDILSREALPIQKGRYDPRFEANVKRLGMIGRGIPPFEEINRTLCKATGWQIYRPAADATTENILARFAQREFPVLSTMRPRSQKDRAEAPDLFHDYWGHLWMLLDPTLAATYEAFGRQNILVAGTSNFKFLSHLYTHTLEFGLQLTRRGVRGIGAALASAPEELKHALGSKHPLRVRLDPVCAADVMRAMRTRYHFSELQETYFVVTDWQALLALLQSDMRPYYAGVADLPRLKPGEPYESDVIIAL